MIGKRYYMIWNLYYMIWKLDYIMCRLHDIVVYKLYYLFFSFTTGYLNYIMLCVYFLIWCLNYILCDLFCIDDGLYIVFPYIGCQIHYIINKYFRPFTKPVDGWIFAGTNIRVVSNLVCFAPLLGGLLAPASSILFFYGEKVLKDGQSGAMDR